MKRFVAVFSFLLVCGVIVLVMAPKSAPAVDEQTLPAEIVVVRAYYDDREMVNKLAAEKEPWEVHHDEGFLVIDVTPAEYNELLEAGFRVEVDEKLTKAYTTPNRMGVNQVNGIPGYSCYRTVEETFTLATDIVTDNPQLASWVDIGDSWEKMTPGGNAGYDMMVLKLTNSAIAGPKPKLFVMSSVHAREYAPAELNNRFAEYLIDNYGTNADATWLLDYHEIHLLLQANPDGRKQAETSLSWRKNVNQNYCSATSNSRGADLNRNFEFEWGCCNGSSGSQCSDTYRGPSAASEPETQAIQNYVRSIFPDQRGELITDPAPDDAMGIFLDVHSYSELVLWSWGFTSNLPPNNTDLVTLGRKFAYFNDYEPQQSIGLYATDGTTDDFAYGELGLAAYTFELGTSFFQDCGTFENQILPDNLEALIYAAKTTGAPYMLPAGPDALDLALSEYGITVGTAVTLTATLNDTRFNNQNGTEPTQAIQAAELYVDVPPWEVGAVAVPLTAVDGNFNSGIEAGHGVIDTNGLVTGKHIVFVRGQDTSTNWGPVTAEFFYVLDAAVSPVIGGRVLAADTGLPLAADIQTDFVFQTTTDATTGMYEMQVVSGTYEITAVPDSTDYAAATVAGVTAVDYQTVQQDFTLYPYCSIFDDDIELGEGDWQADSPWAITTENSHSSTHSWTDSPGGNYGNYRNVSLTSSTLDLSGYQGVELSFWQICDTEAGYDYCVVEASADNGSSWSEISRFDGSHTQWEEVSLELPMIANEPEVKIRFRFNSDQSVIDDGWHVDDIQLRGAGLNCVQSSLVVVSGGVTAEHSGFPLAAVVRTDTGIETTTNPVTGLFVMNVISGTYDLTAVPNSSDYISKTVTITAVDVPLSQNFILEAKPVILDEFVYLPIMLKE